MTHRDDATHFPHKQASEMAPRPLTLAEQVSKPAQGRLSLILSGASILKTHHPTPDVEPSTRCQYLCEALSLREGTEEDAVSWLSTDEAEGGAVVRVTEREDIPVALDQRERRMPWDRRCAALLYIASQSVATCARYRPKYRCALIPRSNHVSAGSGRRCSRRCSLWSRS